MKVVGRDRNSSEKGASARSVRLSFGAGMALYFASQGAGRMAWPFAAGLARLALVWLAGSWWIGPLHGSAEGLFWIVAAGYVLFGAINIFAMATGVSWGEKHRPVRIASPLRS